jgi:hypothetical protein
MVVCLAATELVPCFPPAGWERLLLCLGGRGPRLGGTPEARRSLPCPSETEPHTPPPLPRRSCSRTCQPQARDDKTSLSCAGASPANVHYMNAVRTLLTTNFISHISVPLHSCQTSTTSIFYLCFKVFVERVACVAASIR